MKANAAIAKLLEAGRGRVPLLLPEQRPDRGVRRRGHPPDPRAHRADRARDGRWLHPRPQRQEDRRLRASSGRPARRTCSAAWPRSFRQHAGPGPARRQPAATSLGVPYSFDAKDHYRNTTKWVESINLVERLPSMMRRAFSAASERPARPGHAGDADGRRAARMSTTRPLEAYVSPKSFLSAAGPDEVEAAAQGAGRRAAAGPHGRPGRPLRRGLGGAARARRAAPGAGRDHHERQERLPGGSSALAGGGRRRLHRGRRHVPEASPT